MEYFVGSIILWKFYSPNSVSETSLLRDTDNHARKENEPANVKRPLHVAIIGTGIGGLALAISLQKKGISFSIFERDEKLDDRRDGFGLTLTCGKNGALDKLGVLDECIEEDCPSFCHWIFTPQGKIIGYFGRALKEEMDGLRTRKRTGNLRIPRELLRRILLRKLERDSIFWGKKFVGCSSTQTGIRAHFADFTETTADVLVGADGLNSRVRNWRDANLFENQISDQFDPVTCPEPPSTKRYLGVTAILGITSAVHPLITAQGFYILDGTNRLFTMPYSIHSDGSPKYCMWQLSFSGLSEGEALLLKSAGSNAQLGEALSRTQGWISPVEEMIRATLSKDIWATPLYDRPPMTLRRSKATSTQKDKVNPSGHITVVGDACHPMSMFKGQGANQALLDGPLLASWLSKQGKQDKLTVTQRIQLFEREMVARSSPKVQASHEASSLFHSSQALEEVGGIEGIDSQLSSLLLNELDERGIDSSMGSNLETKLVEVYHELLRNR